MTSPRPRSFALCCFIIGISRPNHGTTRSLHLYLHRLFTHIIFINRTSEHTHAHCIYLHIICGRLHLSSAPPVHSRRRLRRVYSCTFLSLTPVCRVQPSVCSVLLQASLRRLPTSPSLFLIVLHVIVILHPVSFLLGTYLDLPPVIPAIDPNSPER